MDIHQPKLLMEAYYGVYVSNDDNEELSVYDLVLDPLLDEGFKGMDRDKIFRQIRKLRASGNNDRASTLDTLSRKLDTTDERTFSTRESRKNKKGGSERQKAKHLQARDAALSDIKKYGFHEEVDVYDLVLDHLLDEGYADSEQDAIQIMTNMSEEWVDEIVEAFKPLRKDQVGNVEKARKKFTDRFMTQAKVLTKDSPLPGQSPRMVTPEQQKVNRGRFKVAAIAAKLGQNAAVALSGRDPKTQR